MSDKYDVVEALENLGIERISERGDEVTFSCPNDFHARGDRNPSASINKNNYAYHCFSCKAHGSLFSLTADTLGVSMTSAIKWLKQNYWERTETEDSVVSRLKKLLEEETNVESNKLETNSIEEFKVNWDKALEAYKIGKLPSALCRPFDSYGLDVETIKFFDLGYDKLTDRITIPIKDVNGNLASVKGRRALSDEYPKYLGLGNKEEIEKYSFPRLKDKSLVFGLDTATPDLILCEGEFDAMSLRSKGFAGSVAIGTSDTSEEQIVSILKKAETACVMFDPDDAGYKGALKVCDLLYGYIPVKVCILDGNDPATTDKKELQRKLKESLTPLEFREFYKEYKKDKK